MLMTLINEWGNILSSLRSETEIVAKGSVRENADSDNNRKMEISLWPSLLWMKMGIQKNWRESGKNDNSVG